MKYVKKLAEKPIWGSGNIELFDLSRANLNQESREETVVLVASECYGSEPTDRTKLYNKLLTEHCGGPTSSFEFVRDWSDTSLNGCLRNNPNMRTFENTVSEIIGHDMMTSACFNGLATFRLKVPIFLARQIMRHRSFSAQEMSRRYQDHEKAPFEFWFPPEGKLSRDLFDVFESAKHLYKLSVNEGERPEIARAMIPQAAYTTIWTQGDLLAWKNYFNVRLNARAQKEHRDLAIMMFEMLREHKPKFFEHLQENVDNDSEMGYNSDVAEEAEGLASRTLASEAQNRPDRWD